MGSANDAAFAEGRDDASSPCQTCPPEEKEVALYPARYAVSAEEGELPDNCTAPSIDMDGLHYTTRKLSAGWLYMYSEEHEALQEYEVDDNGQIQQHETSSGCSVVPEICSSDALPFIVHPAKGAVFLRFSHHRWSSRIRQLVATDPEVRANYLERFDLEKLPDNDGGNNIFEMEESESVLEDVLGSPRPFEWSITSLLQEDADGLINRSKRDTEFSYVVALNDPVGITSDVGQMHSLCVAAMGQYATEHAYPYMTSQLVDALIEREVSREETPQEAEELRNTLQSRIRQADKERFVRNYEAKMTEFEEERERLVGSWAQWINSEVITKELELIDVYSVEGFQELEAVLAKILDGYVGSPEGREHAEVWLKTDDDSNAELPLALKTVLFLGNRSTVLGDKLSSKTARETIVDSLSDMPRHVNANINLESLMIEFSEVAARMAATDSELAEKWIEGIKKRFDLAPISREITLNQAVDLLAEANQITETAGERPLPNQQFAPLATAIRSANDRAALDQRIVRVFHLDTQVKDNPFGWLNRRMAPVVENLTENRGRLLGGVLFFQLFNLFSASQQVKLTFEEAVLNGRSSDHRTLQLVSAYLSTAEAVVTGTSYLVSKNYAQLHGVRERLGSVRSGAAHLAPTVSSILRSVSPLISAGVRVAVKALPVVGAVASIWLESKNLAHANQTGHSAMATLAGVQIGLSLGLLVVAGAWAATGFGILVGAAIIVVQLIAGVVQLVIARSRIEDLLSASFWGKGGNLRFWDDEARPKTEVLIERARMPMDDEMEATVAKYFQNEVTAFYALFYSPRVAVTDYMHRRLEIDNRGKHTTVSAHTDFSVILPGYAADRAHYEIRLFEVDTRLVRQDQAREITDNFHRMADADLQEGALIFSYSYYNHERKDQLELLIRYRVDDYDVSGGHGFRYVIKGNNAKELSQDESLTDEM